jgi:hypothetical protein
LNSKLREYAKKTSANLPELPSKGNLSMMTPKNDPKLIEFRKFALKNYLQYILFDKKFQECQHLKEFLQLEENRQE